MNMFTPAAMHAASSAEPGQPGRRGSVALRRVVKDYALNGRTLRVLDGIELTVRPGEFLSIVGPSGCGKSTLLRLIVGLDTDYGGEICLDGQRITGTSLDRGLIFQDHRLFPWLTVIRNVELASRIRRLPRAERRATAERLLRLVGLHDFADSWPHQLSGGMAQRVAIARALMNEPALLALDEPLGALDALSRIRIQGELQRIWAQTRCTMIMVTHDVEEAVLLGDRVVVMDANPGRIREIVDVALPHPRDRASPKLQQLREDILRHLDVDLAPAPSAFAPGAPAVFHAAEASR